MLALVLLGPGQSLRERIDLTLHDLLAEQVVAPWQRHRLPDRSGDIAIVAIDDASLQALGRWPWPRARHAELIEALTRAGVQGIGYDILFSEPSDDPAGDRRLARAIASDLSLYNEEKISQGIANDNLFDVLSEEIEEGRQLYKSRVAPDLYNKNFYGRAIVDILVKSKRHIKSKVW